MASEAAETANQAGEIAVSAGEVAVEAHDTASEAASDAALVHEKLDKILSHLDTETKTETKPETVTVDGSEGASSGDETERAEKPSERNHLPGDDKRSESGPGTRQHRRRHRFGGRNLRS